MSAVLKEGYSDEIVSYIELAEHMVKDYSFSPELLHQMRSDFSYFIKQNRWPGKTPKWYLDLSHSMKMRMDSSDHSLIPKMLIIGIVSFFVNKT